MSAPARLLLPGLRFPLSAQEAEKALALAAEGVAGFCLFSADESVRDLLPRLRAEAPHPLIFACDIEDGAGQHLLGATRHPPAAALTAFAAEAAGMLTASEARPRGITMAFAPVADVLSDPRNPILNTRVFRDPSASAPAFVRGAKRRGLRTCAKHFPGHGATSHDSHTELPTVDVDAATWRERDLPPFLACFEAGVDAVMSAHLACPALTGDPALPATLSPKVMSDLLRGEMGFTGLAVSDALLMDGVLRGRTEGEAALAAVKAGCDLVICPSDSRAVLRALDGVDAERLDEALGRIAAASEPLASSGAADPGAWQDALRGAAAASVRSGGGLPLGTGPHPLRICDLHGDGAPCASGFGVAYRNVRPDGTLIGTGGSGGLAAPALCLAWRDKAWGAPLAVPGALVEHAREAALLIVLGPAALLSGLSPRAWVQAPGQDAATVAAVAKRAFIA